MFLETSCLLNRHVADSFETLIELTYRDVLERNHENNSRNLSIDESNKGKKRGCCK